MKKLKKPNCLEDFAALLKFDESISFIEENKKNGWGHSKNYIKSIRKRLIELNIAELSETVPPEHELLYLNKTIYTDDYLTRNKITVTQKLENISKPLSLISSITTNITKMINWILWFISLLLIES